MPNGPRGTPVRIDADRLLCTAALAACVYGVARCFAAALADPAASALGIGATFDEFVSETSRRATGRSAAAAGTRNPFSFSGLWVNHDSLPAASDLASLPAEPLPQLPDVTLKALVGGPPWLAVIDGDLANSADRVLRAGDTLGPATVMAVSSLGVTLQVRDSTWRLEFPMGRQP